MTHDEINDEAARRLLAAFAVQEAAPEGWKLVPIEPTDAMLWDGKEKIDFDRSGQNTHEMEHVSHTLIHDKAGNIVEGITAGTTVKQDMREAWAAMLAAAPQASPAPAVATEKAVLTDEQINSLVETFPAYTGSTRYWREVMEVLRRDLALASLPPALGGAGVGTELTPGDVRAEATPRRPAP